MNIGINGYEAVIPRFGFNKEDLPNRVGSSEFCYQLLCALNKIDKKNNYFIYLPVFPTSDLPKESESWKYIVFDSKKLWTLFGLTRKLSNQKNLNVFFSPTHYLPVTGIKSVISILDVSYLHFPKLFRKKDLYQLKYWGGYSINKAKRIITISHSSKSDIIKAYAIPSSKINIVYPGIKNLNQGVKNDMQNLEKYILFVGTLQPRKNIERLIEAFSVLTSENEFSDFKLIIIGKKGWEFEEILKAPKKYNVEKNVSFLQDVTDEELPNYYKNAQLFVLPSLYEGFGLPVLEAMKYGVPVIVSNVSSLPEAGGDAALYVDPLSVSDIADKMKRVLSDESLRSEMIKKGKKQIEKFSWEKSARQTLAVLEEVVHPVR